MVEKTPSKTLPVSATAPQTIGRGAPEVPQPGFGNLYQGPKQDHSTLQPLPTAHVQSVEEAVGKDPMPDAVLCKIPGSKHELSQAQTEVWTTGQPFWYLTLSTPPPRPRQSLNRRVDASSFIVVVTRRRPFGALVRR
jgi:hypothetical protein